MMYVNEIEVIMEGSQVGGKTAELVTEIKKLNGEISTMKAKKDKLVQTALECSIAPFKVGQIINVPLKTKTVKGKINFVNDDAVGIKLVVNPININGELSTRHYLLTEDIIKFNLKK